MKAALTIAGSDSSGGAGIQADLKTWSAMRVFGCSAITVITAQNTKGVRKVSPVDVEMIEAQIEAVAGDIDCQATKVGLVGSAAAVKTIATLIRRHSLQPLVVDPVLVAKSGDPLAGDEVAASIGQHLLPLAAVATPNRFEAARLLGGQECETIGQGASAARQIAKKFKCHAVIVTGFERPGPDVDSAPEAVDVFFNGEEVVELVGEYRQSTNLHGAGCTFSAAIAGGLAQGKGLSEACEQAKRLVTEAIRQNVNIGQGRGPVNHLAWLSVKG